MPLLKKRSVTAIKVESTAGTAETLSASDAAFNVYNCEITPDIEMVQRPGQSAMSMLSAVPAGYAATATFELDLYTAAAWAGPVLQSCGMVEGASASVDIWTPTSDTTNWKTVTIGKYMDGKLFSMAGAMGTFSMAFRSGQVTRVSCEYKGVWQAPSDTALIAPTYPTATTAAPRWASASALTLAAVSPKVSSLDIALNNEVTLLEDPGTAAALYRAWIADRNYSGSIDPEESLVATYDPHALALARTEVALTNTYDSMSITAPKLQFNLPQPGDRGGVSVHNIDFQLNRSAAAGDDELSIDLTN